MYNDFSLGHQTRREMEIITRVAPIKGLTNGEKKTSTKKGNKLNVSITQQKDTTKQKQPQPIEHNRPKIVAGPFLSVPPVKFGHRNSHKAAQFVFECYNLHLYFFIIFFPPLHL